MTTDHPIAPGQVWRRNSNGLEVEIVDYDDIWDDVKYRVNGRSHWCNGAGFRRRHTFVPDAV